jgi:hypothetical protein
MGRGSPNGDVVVLEVSRSVRRMLFHTMARDRLASCLRSAPTHRPGTYLSSRHDAIWSVADTPSALVGEVDDEKDSTIDYTEIRAEPISEIRH